MKNLLYACVDNLKIIRVPDDLYPQEAAHLPCGAFASDLALGPGTIANPGIYRCVDSRFIGWMESAIYSAKQKSVNPEELNKAVEFVKLLKKLTGLDGVAVDERYRKPYLEFAWIAGDFFDPKTTE